MTNTFEVAQSTWATSKVIDMTKGSYFYNKECLNPQIVSVTFTDGEGEVQIGDMTWDYDEDSVTIVYIDDDRQQQQIYFTQPFSEILQELISV